VAHGGGGIIKSHPCDFPLRAAFGIQIGNPADLVEPTSWGSSRASANKKATLLGGCFIGGGGGNRTRVRKSSA